MKLSNFCVNSKNKRPADNVVYCLVGTNHAAQNIANEDKSMRSIELWLIVFKIDIVDSKILESGSLAVVLRVRAFVLFRFLFFI